ncbi:MAG: acyl carrier protein [Kiritimatiellia bacterium]
MTLEEKVIALVADSLHQDASAIKTDSSFVNDLGADSLDQAELMMSIEDAFKSFMNGESIPEEEAQKFETVGSVIEFLKSKGVPENL